MDFIGGALPNVMFLIGVIAIGIGLGLEFQIIQVKNGLTRGGRIGASLFGLALVVTSIILYLQPAQTASVAPAPGVAGAAAAASAITPPVAAASSPAATPEPSETAELPTATPAPATATSAVTATPEQPTATATSEVTATPEQPTATEAPATVTAQPAATAAPAATAEPLAVVPDLRGREPKEARQLLEGAGLRLGEERRSCEELGDSRSEAADVRRGRIACQSIEPGSTISPQTAIDYAVASDKGPGRDD